MCAPSNPIRESWAHVNPIATQIRASKNTSRQTHCRSCERWLVHVIGRSDEALRKNTQPGTMVLSVTVDGTAWSAKILLHAAYDRRGGSSARPGGSGETRGPLDHLYYITRTPDSSDFCNIRARQLCSGATNQSKHSEVTLSGIHNTKTTN